MAVIPDRSFNTSTVYPKNKKALALDALYVEILNPHIIGFHTCTMKGNMLNINYIHVQGTWSYLVNRIIENYALFA